MGKGAINMGVCPITILAVGTVSAHRFVTAAGAQAGADANVLGVAAYDGVDEDTTVDTLGIVSVEAGAAVAADAELSSDASGRAVTKVGGPTVARSLDAAAAAGELIRCSLIPN